MIVENLTYNLPDRTPLLQKDFLYFDIETTGLQKKNGLIYLIGSLEYLGEGACQIHQWFAENPDEEQEILKEFLDYASSFSGFAHFNGNRFDIPFLTFRCQLYQLPPPFEGKLSRDLYQIYKHLQKRLGLNSFRQRDLEEYLKLTRENPYTGKDCIQIYRDLIKFRDISYAQPLLLHNREDLQGLAALEAFQGYEFCRENTLTLLRTSAGEKTLSAQLQTRLPIPRPIVWRYEEWHMEGENHRMDLTVELLGGYLKNYYSNYQDYYYLPGEDAAVHKSVAAYMEKNLRKKATPYNCYTRFLPQEDFFSDRRAVEEYICHNLPLLLSLN